LLDAGGIGMPPERAVDLFNVLPALFVENQGQWAEETVQYAHSGDSANVLHTSNGPVFQLFQQEGGIETGDMANPLAEADEVVTRHTQFTMGFDGASQVDPVGLDQVDTVHNYFVGDQADWRTGLPTYETVAYLGLYDGIDLLTWGKRDSLKYEFRVAPGADYQQISLSFTGIDGLSIDSDGALHVSTELGELIDTAPYIYQEVGGQPVEVAGSFLLRDADTFSFAITGDYDPNTVLVIDPVLDWSTYLGGGSGDYARGIATDALGNTLVTGRTWFLESGWVSGGFDTIHDGNWDAYVAKLSVTGDHLWSSYLGGTSHDDGQGIAVDATGNALVTGFTDSDGWVSGGFDTSHNGSFDAFVAKLSSEGGHLWSTYLGGGNDDHGYGIAVEA
jgi:hypothetical protein